MLKNYWITPILILIMSISHGELRGQNNETPVANDKPIIYYSASPKEYEVAGIKVEGMPNYEDYILINISKIAIGDKIYIPGDKITKAIKSYWKYGLFSDVKIEAEKIEGDKVWLSIKLQERPRISKIVFHGLKKKEQEDLEERLQLSLGTQVTPNLINTAERIITKQFVDKGFLNTEVDIRQKNDVNKENFIELEVFVDKRDKVKINQLTIVGNEVLSTNKVNRTLKKTNQRRLLRNFFRSKKFLMEQYEADKIALIEKYNSLGYRDAIIAQDSISKNVENNTVDLVIKIDEGKQYFFRNITWVGNTKYSSKELDFRLQLKHGDVYNTKLFDERLNIDEDAISNLYLDNGYLFFNIDPIEVNVENDSVDMEIRIVEGRQASINKVLIKGNNQTHEHVARRELRTKPGDLFSKSDIIRSVRELSNLGHFDPEQINPVPKPNPSEGTVDLEYNLAEKDNSQLELSGGYAQGSFMGTLGLSFSNFSIRNIFNFDTYAPVPTGDGQKLSLRAQTNGSYYQSYSISFLEPWLGGKRPNSLSVSGYYSKQTNVSSTSGYTSPYGYNNSGYGYGYGNNGYGYGEIEYDPTQYIKVYGASAGLGRRLSWPDDYFTLYTSAAFQVYDLKNWNYFIIFDTGKSKNINFSLVLGRSSIDQPIYTRKGSNFSLSLEFTPPYSAFNDIDYSQESDQVKYEWIEYHKWKFDGAVYTPLDSKAKFVLMTRAQMGLLGYYDKNRRSPFETFYVGGDGMSGTGSYGYGNETIGLRGYENGAVTSIHENRQIANAFTKFTLELRYPISLEQSSVIYALSFLEAGNSWYEIKDINPYKLKRSAGVGLRIFLPMFGLMGIDWAYGFDRDNRGGLKASGSQFHFVLGQQF